MPNSPKPRPAPYPSTLKTGDHRYRGPVQRRVEGSLNMGRIHRDLRRMEVAAHSGLKGLPDSPNEVLDTFWREMMRRILYEMVGHGNFRNESLVRQFASLPTKAIESATFG